MSRERSPRLASPEGMAAFRERATSPKASERPPSKGIASEFVRPLANDKAAVTADEEEETFQVAMRQNAMEFEAADVDNSETLDFEEFCAFIREREEHPLGRHPPNELLARFGELDRNHNGRIEMHEYLMFSLRDALSRSVTRVLDLLQAWDDDGSGDISKKEFRQAIKALGFEARQKEVDAVFDEMDNDGSGKLDYREMNQKIREFAGLTSQNKYPLRRTAGGRKGAALSTSVKIDHNSEVPLSHQLRNVLKENAVRVIDLFRDWDEDGDGTISKKEFAKVMPVLGVSIPQRDMDELFDLFDPDGSGLIEFNELNALLRQKVDDPTVLAFKPWVAYQVAEKLRQLGDADSCALCMHTTSTLSVRSHQALPIIDQRAAATGIALDEAHRKWMMPMKGQNWRQTHTGELPPLAFSSSVRPRRPRPPALIKAESSPKMPPIAPLTPSNAIRRAAFAF